LAVVEGLPWDAGFGFGFGFVVAFAGALLPDFAAAPVVVAVAGACTSQRAEARHQAMAPTVNRAVMSL
jgi:hypothetical protein